MAEENHPDIALLSRVLDLIQAQIQPIRDAVLGLGRTTEEIAETQTAEPTRRDLKDFVGAQFLAHREDCSKLHATSQYVKDVATIRRMARWIIISAGVISTMAVPIFIMLHEHNDALMKLTEAVEKLPK